MKFYLHDGFTDSSVAELGAGSRTTLPNPRFFIDSRPHELAVSKGHPFGMIESCDAKTWREARRHWATFHNWS